MNRIDFIRRVGKGFLTSKFCCINGSMKRGGDTRHILAWLQCFFLAVTEFAVLSFTAFGEDLSPEVKSVIDRFLQQHIAFCGGDAYSTKAWYGPENPDITCWRYKNFRWKATIMKPTQAEQLNGVEYCFQLDMSADAYREYLDLKGKDGWTNPVNGWEDWRDFSDQGLVLQFDKRDGAWYPYPRNGWTEEMIAGTAPTCAQINTWLTVPPLHQHTQ